LGLEKDTNKINNIERATGILIFIFCHYPYQTSMAICLEILLSILLSFKFSFGQDTFPKILPGFSGPDFIKGERLPGKLYLKSEKATKQLTNQEEKINGKLNRPDSLLRKVFCSCREINAKQALAGGSIFFKNLFRRKFLRGFFKCPKCGLNLQAAAQREMEVPE